MITLPANATDKEILEVARKWAAVLARQDYDAAFAMTAHDPYFRWTPDLIKAVIQGYGLPEPRWDGKIFRVTPIESAVGGPPPPPRHEVKYYEQPHPISETDQMAVGEVWFDLPLNGEWSDLTVTFKICRSEDRTVLVLNEIHVF